MYEQFVYVIYLIMVAYLFTCLYGYGCFVIYRLCISKRSIFENKNYCEVCGESFHNIYSYPIVGYLLSGGKCKKCNKSFGNTHFMVESAMFIMTFAFFTIIGFGYKSLTASILYLIIALFFTYLDLNKGEKTGENLKNN